MTSIKYNTWSRFTTEYNPLEAGSIDRTDLKPHDNAILRALSAEYFPPNHIEGNPENTIFVARLNRQSDEDTVKKVFSHYGRVKKCTLIRNIVTGISRGFAFVEYYHKHDAMRAYAGANHMDIDGKKIFVDRELGRVLKGWVPRRLGGGLGGKKESGQLRFGGRDRHFKMPFVPIQSSSSGDPKRGDREGTDEKHCHRADGRERGYERGKRSHRSHESPREFQY
ncbi:U11/U12 small nuclear ribonucleoprotein 35 kDa protein-like [Ischnura elegans]|uniref:U11/U12 small nuclear ribonucleoprotein 35 kDa protein-like n=1 Tax=Ischnura elegans TaxID=197161 RepID=UPI001ED8A357|nr:U11/U12 small nuclear ribonucleoprotein 35 kDa protein-like [Ischnura elegans]